MVVGTAASSASMTTSTGPAAAVLVENVSSAPLASMGTIPSATNEPRLFNLISQASATPAVSCPVPPPMPTIVVAVTASPVSTPLPSS
ncbi:hypothetical protein Hanom_Chr00s000003g01603871 [Helianthus anomalus]